MKKFFIYLLRVIGILFAMFNLALNIFYAYRFVFFNISTNVDKTFLVFVLMLVGICIIIISYLDVDEGM